MTDEEPMSPLENIKWAMTVMEETKRTVVCSPEMESRVKEILKRNGMADCPVFVNPWCDDKKIYVIDTNAIDASMAEGLQRSINNHQWHSDPN